jgi:hypothetical protein
MAKKRLIGVLFILLSFSITTVSAYVYEQAQHQVTQTIQNIATLAVQNSALGNIEEGQTLFYTPSNQSDLDNIISVTTTKANVYLHLNSDLDSLNSYYSTYSIVVKFDSVLGGSSHSSGSTACTLSLASPDYSSVDLDVAGTWTFDFEITTTAQSVSANQPTTVTIVVTAESS